MTEQEHGKSSRIREVAKVDFLVDENGMRLPLPDDTGIRAAGNDEQAIGSTGPANWWRLAMVMIAVVIVVVLALQFFASGNRSTAPVTPAAQTSP